MRRAHFVFDIVYVAVAGDIAAATDAAAAAPVHRDGRWPAVVWAMYCAL